MKSKLKYTLKAWPVIAVATIGLCYLTQLVSSWFGVELKEQANVETVRQLFLHAFDTKKAFLSAAFNVALIVAILPAFEEVVFRGPLRWLKNAKASFFAGAVILSVLFTAAHYFAQPWPDNAFVALFFFGLAQASIYRRTGSLWCAILNHALFNLTNLVLLLMLPAPK